jgi:hypothetical protein
MDDDTEESKRMRAIQLVHEGGNRLLAQERCPRREIDQVAGVRDDRPDARFMHSPAEPRDLFPRERRPQPLAGILGKDLQRLAAVQRCAVDCVRDPTSHRHVRADPYHLSSSRTRLRTPQTTSGS